jgi:hypothetical protein
MITESKFDPGLDCAAGLCVRIECTQDRLVRAIDRDNTIDGQVFI